METDVISWRDSHCRMRIFATKYLVISDKSSNFAQDKLTEQ